MLHTGSLAMTPPFMLSCSGRGVGHRPLRIVLASLGDGARVDHQATVLIHAYLEQVQGPRRRSEHEDRGALRVSGPMAGAAEPAGGAFELEVRPPGHGATQVGALLVDGQHAAR